MKQHNRFTKRFLALFLVLCFVLGQINLPAGLIKISPDFSFLHTKAAGETFTEKLDVANIINESQGSSATTKVTFHFTVLSGNNVTISGVTTSEFADAGSSHLTIPSTISHNGTTYTITGIGSPSTEGSGEEGKTVSDALSGLTSLHAINLPRTIKNIYSGAFNADKNLVTVILEENSQLETIERHAFNGCFLGSTNNFPTELEDAAFKISLPDTITSIGNNAFQGCDMLKEVVIADGAEVSLGDEVFANLKISLETVKLPNSTKSIGKRCFLSCQKLKTIGDQLPNNKNFTTIPESAFEDCSLLSLNVKFSEYITSIGKSCFAGCKELIGVDFSDCKITEIPEKAFYNCSSITGQPNFNEGLVTIGTSAFEECTSLCSATETTSTRLSFPTTLNVIGDKAFYHCSAITSLDWTNTQNDVACNITSLGEAAFSLCNSLGNTIIPSTLTEIPNELFYGCTNIGRIVIPTSITKIGDNAFNNCTQLANIFYYEDNANNEDEHGTNFRKSQITSIGVGAFASTKLQNFYAPPMLTAIQEATFQRCSMLTVLELHNNIQKIEKNAFYNCTTLGKSATTPLVIPASVETIGQSIFEGCSSLKAVSFSGELSSLPDNKMPSGVFKDCTSLQSVVLPSSIKNISTNLFSGDTQLTSLTMPGFDEITQIEDSGFYNCSSFTGFNGDTSGEITFPSTFTNLGPKAFSGCKKISKVDLGATKISIINTETFAQSGLKTIIFSKNLTGINAKAFEGCSLGAMTFQNVNAVAKIAQTAVRSVDGTERYLDSNIVITVPANLLEDYQKLFADLGFSFTSSQFKTSIIGASFITLSINPNRLNVGAKATAKITQDGSEGASLFSTNDNIVKVVDNSTIEAVSLGTTTITAKTASGLTSNPITVTVIPGEGAAPYVKNPITSIVSGAGTDGLGTASNNSADYEKALFEGDEVAITVTTDIDSSKGDNNKDEDSLIWSLKYGNDNNSIVYGSGNTVANDYVSITYTQRTGTTATATIKVLKYTPTQITATCASNCSSVDIPIRISQKYTAINPKQASASIDYSSTPTDARTLFSFVPNATPEKINWSSNNPSVATINENGQITCVSPGQVTITATGMKSGIATSVALTIKNDITEVKTTDGVNSYNVIAGQSLTITATTTLKNQNMTSPDSITWTSSDENTAKISVTPNGNNYTIAVTTLKVGSVSIQGKNAAGQQKCSISVRINPVRFEKSSFSIYTAGPNKKATIKPQGADGKALASNIPVSYAMADSKSKKAASVSASGVISGKKKGAAKVTVTVYGVPYTINVNVSTATLGVSISGASANKKKTQYKISKKAKKATLSYSANYLGSVKKKVSYKSSKKSVATISKKGVIKLKKKGTTKITVTVNGVKKTFKLKVVK